MTPVCCLFQGIKYLSPPLWCLNFELVGCPPTIKNCDLVAYLNYVLMLRMRIMHGLAFYTCISFLDLLQKKNYYELHGLKKQNFFSHIPENKSPISRWGQSHVPCEISRGESLSLLASGSPGAPWSVAASFQSLPPSSHGFPYMTSSVSTLLRTSFIGMRTSSKSRMISSQGSKWCLQRYPISK